MKNIFFIIAAVFALTANAQTEVNSFSAGSNEGVTYCLPDTKIEITAEATCIVRTPGDFSRYAERYLRIKNVISEAESSWILGSISVGNKGFPNPDKIFTIKLNNSTASNIRLNERGIIAAINCEPAKEEAPPAPLKDRRGGSIDASQYMTGEMLQATSTAKLAELAAKEIYTIRESKLAITRGQAENMPGDGHAMQLVLEELDKQEKALTELFTGRTDTICHRFTFSITPSAEECDTTKAVLFRFSRKLGVLDKENLAGEPVYYDLKDLKSVEVVYADDNGKRKTLKKEGICYNVPGSAAIEIYTRSRKLAKADIAIAQLGTTEILSKTLFNKSNATKVIFNTADGSIKSITKQ